VSIQYSEIGSLSEGIPFKKLTVGGGGASITRYRDSVLADSPAAYFRKAEPSGTTLVDSVGAFSGTYVNAPTLGVASAISDTGDKAVSYAAASSQRGDCPIVTTLIDNFTLELWVKLPNLTNQDALFATNGGDRTAAGGWALGMRDAGTSTDNPGLSLAALYPGSAWVSTNYVFADTNWHMIDLIRRSGTAEIYMDGSPVTVTGNGASVPNLPNTSFVIAADKNLDAGFQRYFNGSLDEISVYLTAISSARVAAHWAAR
jgi:hypothetical protein